MGQYFKAVNVSKKEYVDPWYLGVAKLWEWCVNKEAGLFPYLLRKSNESGGGDIRNPDAKYAAVGLVMRSTLSVITTKVISMRKLVMNLPIFLNPWLMSTRIKGLYMSVIPMVHLAMRMTQCLLRQNFMTF